MIGLVLTAHPASSRAACGLIIVVRRLEDLIDAVVCCLCRVEGGEAGARVRGARSGAREGGTATNRPWSHEPGHVARAPRGRLRAGGTANRILKVRIEELVEIGLAPPAELPIANEWALRWGDGALHIPYQLWVG